MTTEGGSRPSNQAHVVMVRRAEKLVLLLAVTGNVVVVQILPRAAYLPANLVLALGAVAVARNAGMTTHELGLARAALPHGLHSGIIGSMAVLAVVTLGVLGPTRPLFADTRVLAPRGRAVAYESLVRIPFGTALAEEVLFRGVLLGLALRRFSPTHAVARSALLFGFWHILPAIASVRAHAAGIVPRTPGGMVLIVAGTVAATSAGGACFAWLRLRTGSIVAPVLIHATLNVAAFWAVRMAAG